MRKRALYCLYCLLAVVLLVILSGCGTGSGQAGTSASSGPPAGSAEMPQAPDATGGTSGSSGVTDSSGGLSLNKTILANMDRPFSDILKEEPNLKPESLACIDASAMCFVDSSKPYSYILFVTQYLPYDEYAAAAIQQRDIRCAGIYTTVSELFPDLTPGGSPEECFDKSGVENFSTDEPTDYGIAYNTYFDYEGMSFSVWGGTADSPAVVSADDTVMVQIPTNNEDLINEYYNDKMYPDGIGCEAAMNFAKEYRASHGVPDCTFSIMRDGVIDATPEMNLPDEKVYIVSPNLDEETDNAENSPVYYVGYKTGGVYEEQTMSND